MSALPPSKPRPSTARQVVAFEPGPTVFSSAVGDESWPTDSSGFSTLADTVANLALASPWKVATGAVLDLARPWKRAVVARLVLASRWKKAKVPALTLASPWQRATAAVVAVLLVVLGVRALSAKPSATAASVDPVYAEASARWAIAIQSQRVDDFIRSYRRAPATLDEIGGNPWDAITYERVDIARYRLVAPGPNNAIVYDSVEPLADFVGKSREILLTPRAEHSP